MTRVAILISGGGSNMVRLIEAMQQPGHPATPVLVGSNDPQAAGLARAEHLGVPVFAIDHRDYRGDRAGFEAALIEKLDEAAPDLVCLAGFMRILTPQFTDHYAGRLINIHPSLLPLYPGLDTHRRALEAGDREAGASVHEVTAELDAGPILGQIRVPVLAGDTPETLAKRVLRGEHVLYPNVLARLVSGKRDRIDLTLDE